MSADARIRRGDRPVPARRRQGLDGGHGDRAWRVLLRAVGPHPDHGVLVQAGATSVLVDTGYSGDAEPIVQATRSVLGAGTTPADPRVLLRRRPGPPWYTTWNPRLARDSVQRLAALKPAVLAGGHGPPLAGPDTAALVEAFARHAGE